MKNRSGVSMSIVSRFFVALAAVSPPLCNQMLMEGEGAVDMDRWRKALQIASEKNRGSRFILKGRLKSCRWVDSEITPRIREVNGGSWDGQGSEGAPFFLAPLDPFKGPTSEVLLIHGDPLRIVFRTHHGVMDGMGTITWVEDIFHALNGRPVKGSVTSVIEDELMNAAPSVQKPLPQHFIPVAGGAKGTGAGMAWKRIRITGQFKKLLPQLVLAVAREAWREGKGPVRIGIPVDLRPRREGLRSTNNLTSIFILAIEPEMGVSDIAAEISRRLKEKNDGAYTWEDKLIQYLPLTFIQTALQREIRKNHQRERYRYSGIISNLGRLPLAQFTGGGFEPETFFFIPPTMATLPFGMTINGAQNHVELVATLPEIFGSGGRLDALLKRIASSVEGGE